MCSRFKSHVWQQAYCKALRYVEHYSKDVLDIESNCEHCRRVAREVHRRLHPGNLEMNFRVSRVNAAKLTLSLLSQYVSILFRRSACDR